MMHIAYFITPHGFGHASRSAAVMGAVLRISAEVRFELFTTCPQQIFKDSIGDHFGYHPVQTDIGMVQRSPLEVDLSATCDRLDQLLPYDSRWIDDLAGRLKQHRCRLVVCDIAPLGIAVARAAGIPSMLIENFNWDWIYQHYRRRAPRLEQHIAYLSNLTERVDHHIQTPPLCSPSPKALFMGPMSRPPRTERSRVRRQLGVADQEKMVLVSMGGVPDRFEFLSRLPSELDCRLVVPGVDGLSSPHEKVILLPTHSQFYHPDLMMAADVLVGKAGYSTVAEAYQTGIPFGYIKRPDSPESAVLETFISQQMPAMAIPTEAYASGRWVAHIPKLLQIPRGPVRRENGADEAATYIINLLQGPEDGIPCVAKGSQ